MAVGVEVQLSGLNAIAGDICKSLTHQINRAIAYKRFLDRFDVPTLVTTYGFTTGDANILKSAFTDLAAINTTFQANRAFLDQLAGIGDV